MYNSIHLIRASYSIKIYELRECEKLAKLCEKVNKNICLKDDKLIDETYDTLIVGHNSFELFLNCELFYSNHLTIELWFINA